MPGSGSLGLSGMAREARRPTKAKPSKASARPSAHCRQNRAVGVKPWFPREPAVSGWAIKSSASKFYSSERSYGCGVETAMGHHVAMDEQEAIDEVFAAMPKSVRDAGSETAVAAGVS